MNEKELADLIETVNEIMQNTSTNQEIENFVEARISEREYMNVNLKRDNTHIIVSPPKKTRQTEGYPGLMPFE